MAAPEYLVKLKFGTEVDQKAFNELKATYDQLGQKQKAAFAKQYGSSLNDMNQLFKKETNTALKNYEKAAIKTEQNLTAARVKELRAFITKRQQQMARLPAYAGGALAAGGTVVANAAIQSSFGMTEFTKNTVSGGMNMGLAGGAAGLAVAGPIGAVVGAAVGSVAGVIAAEFENSAEAIKRSATLFNDAVQTYRATLDFTKGMTSGMAGAGFTDVGEYQVYKQALKAIGIENDSFMNDLARSLASYKETASLGNTLINARRDQGLQLLYEQWKASGKTAREFVMGSTASGGLNQSDFRADALIALFEAGGMEAAIQKTLSYIVQKGGKASDISDPIRVANEQRIDLEMREWAQKVKNINELTAEGVDMNEDIIKEQDMSFNRSLKLMKESTILLSGINESYRMYEEELKQIFSYITGKTGVGTSHGERAKKALQEGGVEGLKDYLYNPHGYPMSKVEPMMTRIDKADNRVHQTRLENSPISINQM